MVSAVNVEKLATRRPWELLGISRSSWYEAQAAGETPAPIEVPHMGRFWRISDIRRWLETRKPGRRRRRKAES